MGIRKASLDKKQKKLLQVVFNIDRFPNSSTRKFLAEYLGLRERTVQIWFQNERQKYHKPTSDNLNYKNVYTGRINQLVDISLALSSDDFE